MQLSNTSGKGWTPLQEEIISQIIRTERMLADETSMAVTASVTRAEAIRRMCYRGWNHLSAVPPVYVRQDGYCQHCGLVLPSDYFVGAKYCDAQCQRKAKVAIPA